MQIDYNSYGKPYLKDYKNFKFSLSHTRELVVIAISNEFEIGVDVEHLDREINYNKVSDLLFTTTESELFKTSDPASHQENFINCWTRKEAFFKAKGVGLTFPFNQLEVSFLKEEKPEIKATKWRQDEKSEWFLDRFNLPGNYRGALAVHGPVHTFELIRVKDVQHDFAFLFNEIRS